jgi:hypothetical protein
MKGDYLYVIDSALCPYAKIALEYSKLKEAVTQVEKDAAAGVPEGKIYVSYKMFARAMRRVKKLEKWAKDIETSV